MSDPINNPPSYYLLPGGTEIREMIRQARGDESTIEHLAQSIMEYASRLGKKPGASRADDFRKIARNAIQGANVCEGRSVSDNGDPPTEPDQHALATAIRQAIAILTPRANCVTGVGCDIQAAVNALTDAVGSEPAPTPAQPPEPERPSVALPVVFAGEKTARSGLYIELDSRGIPRRALVGEGYEADSTLLGPVPPACEWPKPEGEREGEDA